MTLSLLALVAGFTASAIGLTITLPQTWRLVRSRDHSGVSVMTWSLNLVYYLAWLSYGLLIPSPAQIPGNAVSALLGLVLLLVLWHSGARLMPGFLTALPIALTLAFTAFLLGATWVGWLATLVGFTMRIPQVRALRTPASSAGVSLSTWYLSALANVFWILYALLRSDFPVLVTGVWGLGTSLLIVHLARRSRRSLAGLARRPEEIPRQLLSRKASRRA